MLRARKQPKSKRSLTAALSSIIIKAWSMPNLRRRSTSLSSQTFASSSTQASSASPLTKWQRILMPLSRSSRKTDSSKSLWIASSKRPLSKSTAKVTTPFSVSPTCEMTRSALPTSGNALSSQKWTSSCSCHLLMLRLLITTQTRCKADKKSFSNTWANFHGTLARCQSRMVLSHAR